MTETVGYAVEGGVAVLTVHNPPVNALSRAVRADLMEAIDRAEEDDSVGQIMIVGEGATFPAGGELTEYDGGLHDPSLRDVCERLEFCEKPVVAAMHGTVYGGGFELALAAHYRLAAKSARVSLPEIRLGLPPSAGASQRLPRLLGARRALDILLKAPILPVDIPETRPLLDGIADGDIRQAGLRFCAVIADKGQGPRRLSQETRGLLDMADYMEVLEEARADLPKGFGEAPARIVDLVEAAALLPFEAGLAMEEDVFENCLASDDARALRHAFVAERRAGRFDMPDLPPRPQIDRIAVLGAGPLALQIAITALAAGLAVHWGTRDPARAAEGARQIAEVFDQNVTSGALRVETAKAHLRRLKTGASEDMTEGVDMILHAAPGQGDVPAPKGIVRAVAMASAVEEIGLRFAPPVLQARLVEVVQGPKGTAAQVSAALALAARFGKVPVHVRSSGDSIAGRLGAALHRACDGLLDLGADPYAVDAALADWGWDVHPFQKRDLMGFAQLAKAPRGLGATNWSAVLAEEGRAGQASTLGFYRWSDDGAHPDPALAEILDARRAPKVRTEQDMVGAVLGAMANEGVRMLETGMAQRSSDIDVVSILALQMPPLHGGVMKAVSLHGLFATQTLLTKLDHPDSAFWLPVERWRDLVKNGQTFDVL